jgi:enoyl-CoA hydratase/carnithine racemase
MSCLFVSRESWFSQSDSVNHSETLLDQTRIPSRVVNITGTGCAFCADADLKAHVAIDVFRLDQSFSKLLAHSCSWLEITQSGLYSTARVSSLASIARRRTLTKPLVAAVNGICSGSGM